MRRLVLLALTLTVLASATPAAQAASTAPVTIRLVTHDSFAVSKSVLDAFTRQTGITVDVLPSGDAGAALNQVILTKSSPIGDAFYGLDNTFLSRALDAGIFQPYQSPQLASVRSIYQLDSKHRVTPIDHGDVCINYDKTWFASHRIPVPASLDDLTKPAYKGRLVVENPATSSPGLAFVLATIARYGDGGWRGYWAKLRANDVQVVDGWDQAYNGSFSAGGGNGTVPLVVSYASSPPAAVVNANPQPAQSPVGTMLSSCFRQIEFLGILKTTRHAAAARKLVDFMLSQRFQADMPLQMYVFPVRDGTPLPTVFTKFAEVTTNPLTIPAAQIGRNRERWINEWTAAVLR
ncbi:MAG TPA: thiamine ABC transporter substrate-binding protein [Acidimicrobiia bacterium]|nr:thiamine ABC transporter substrate-binding protein [Acidimicrobiia bacterium]